MINVHASLLPKYRGAAPVHRAVIDGDAETGVTIMRVVKALDAGPMFATVDASDRPGRHERRRRRRARRRSAPSCCSSGSRPDRLRDRARGTTGRHAGDAMRRRLTKEEGLIDWSQPALRDSQPGARALSVAACLHASERRAAHSCWRSQAWRVADGPIRRLPGTILERRAGRDHRGDG